MITLYADFTFLINSTLFSIFIQHLDICIWRSLSYRIQMCLILMKFHKSRTRSFSQTIVHTYSGMRKQIGKFLLLILREEGTAHFYISKLIFEITQFIACKFFEVSPAGRNHCETSYMVFLHRAIYLLYIGKATEQD